MKDVKTGLRTVSTVAPTVKVMLAASKTPMWHLCFSSYRETSCFIRTHKFILLWSGFKLCLKIWVTTKFPNTLSHGYWSMVRCLSRAPPRNNHTLVSSDWQVTCPLKLDSWLTAWWNCDQSSATQQSQAVVSAHRHPAAMNCFYTGQFLDWAALQIQHYMLCKRSEQLHHKC